MHNNHIKCKNTKKIVIFNTSSPDYYSTPPWPPPFLQKDCDLHC